MLMVACTGFALSPSLVTLLLSTSCLGIAPSAAGHQPAGAVCTRQSAPGGMARMIGNCMVANAVGARHRPLDRRVVGRLRQHSADAFPDSAIGLDVSVLTFRVCLLLRPSGPRCPARRRARPIPVSEIARIPGIRVIFFVSVVTVAAQDLIVVYMPLLDRAQPLAVDAVGCAWAGPRGGVDARASCSPD